MRNSIYIVMALNLFSLLMVQVVIIFMFLRLQPEAFARAPQKSIDYAVMEKTDRVDGLWVTQIVGNPH